MRGAEVAVSPRGDPSTRRRDVSLSGRAKPPVSQAEASLFGQPVARSMSHARQAVKDATKLLAMQSSAEPPVFRFSSGVHF